MKNKTCGECKKFNRDYSCCCHKCLHISVRESKPACENFESLPKTTHRFKEEFTLRREKYKKAEDDLCRLFSEYKEELEYWIESALECRVEDFSYRLQEEKLWLYLYSDKEYKEIWAKIDSLNLPFDVLPIIIESDEDEEI